MNLDYEPNSFKGDIELKQIRNINGVTIVVTLKLTQEQLTILGDVRGSKSIKIIEIPRG